MDWNPKKDYASFYDSLIDSHIDQNRNPNAARAAAAREKAKERLHAIGITDALVSRVTEARQEFGRPEATLAELIQSAIDARMGGYADLPLGTPSGYAADLAVPAAPPVSSKEDTIRENARSAQRHLQRLDRRRRGAQ